MPLRLFPFAFALILGAVYLLGGFERNDDNLVGVHESGAAVEDAITNTLSDSAMHDAEDSIIGFAEPARDNIDVPFD